MRKIKKITEKLHDELNRLRESRKSIDDFFYSFLNNYYENCKLIHHFKENAGKNNEFLKIAYRQYFVFLVSSWETFYRDIFVYIHTIDETLISKLLDRINQGTEDLDLRDIPLSELLSKNFNFQNLEELEIAFNDLWDGNFLEFICSSDISPCAVNGKVYGGMIIKNLFSDWQSYLKKAFSIRHNVVHDANFRPEFDLDYMKKIETLFLLIPQYVTHFVSLRYGLPRIIFSNGEEKFTTIFTVSDLLDDWEIVTEEQLAAERKGSG